MNPEKIREDFPIFQEKEGMAYLDSAATSQKPEKVIKRIEKFYREENANAGRGLYDLANTATSEYREARRKTADFIGADTDEIIFLRNTTEAENLLAESLEFDGDIVLSRMSHHSEQLPWRRKADEEDREIRWLETEKGRIEVEEARKKIDEDVGLVAITHVSNVFGAENSVKEIIEVAHENDAFVVLDAAQSVPHMPVDVRELDADFVCFSGHKMLGPSGIGVLYGKKKLLDEMPPYQVGGGMIRKVSSSEIEYSDTPEKFEAGTPNIAGAAGIAAAIDYIEEIGREDIHDHDRRMVEKAKKGLEEIEGVEIISPEDSIILSFTCDFAHPHDIAEILNQNDVAVRAGHHCAQLQMEQLDVNGSARFSPYVYTTEEEVRQFIEAVKEVRRVFTDVQG